MFPGHFSDNAELVDFFRGKTVAIVGSGPSVTKNKEGFIDGHDVVVRVNNYRITTGTGKRCDAFYSFFGNSIKKTKYELKKDGVRFCICKCPDAHAFDSKWHQKNKKMAGVDYRWIYAKRSSFWFCKTYVPSVAEFMEVFNMLDRHIPTTGFSAILRVLECEPKAVYLTGFDFFRSGIHNVSDKWLPGRLDDPVRHVPEAELKWLARNLGQYPVTVDKVLGEAMQSVTDDIRIQEPALSGIHQAW